MMEKSTYLLYLLLLSTQIMLPSAMFADPASNSFVRPNESTELETGGVNVNVTTNPVVVEIYYDTLDLICQMYMLSFLRSTWEDVGEDPSVIDYRLIPFGPGVEIKQKDGSYKFICRKGPKECLYQTYQACVFHLYDYKFEHFNDLFNCMITSLWINDHQPKSTIQCVERHSIYKWEDIEKCANGTLGNQLMHKYAVKTRELKPFPTWWPHMVVDGVNNKHTQHEAKWNLIKLVCDLWEAKNHQRLKNCNKYRTVNVDVDIAVM